MNFMNLALVYAWQHVAVAYMDACKTLPLPTLNINLGATWLPKLLNFNHGRATKSIIMISILNWDNYIYMCIVYCIIYGGDVLD